MNAKLLINSRIACILWKIQKTVFSTNWCIKLILLLIDQIVVCIALFDDLHLLHVNAMNSTASANNQRIQIMS